MENKIMVTWILLKQDTYCTLWLDYNKLLLSTCPGNIFWILNHIMWFSLPSFRSELVSLKREWQNNISYQRPWFQNAQNRTLFHTQTFLSVYLYIYSLCKGILPAKDLHPLLKFPAKGKIFQKREKHNISYQPSVDLSRWAWELV